MADVMGNVMGGVMGARRRPLLLWLAVLAWSLACPLPAMAADQFNPAGHVISGRNPGMPATADGQTLSNAGRIEAVGTGQTSSRDGVIGMGFLPQIPSMGFPSWGSVFRNLTLVNSGSITTCARAGTVDTTTTAHDNTNFSMSAFNTAATYGMLGLVKATLVNSGSINASIWGGTANADVDASHTSTNANADATAGTYAYGMGSMADSILTNSGSINACAWGGTAYANASNASNAFASAKASANACGMGSMADSTLINSGSINACAWGGRAEAYASTNVNVDAGAYAYGMAGEASSTLVNSGSINAYAWGGTANASTSPASTNVNVDAGAYAYGMVLSTGMSGMTGMTGMTGTVANHGVIRVGATGSAEKRAHELFAMDGTVRIRAWALDLRDFSDTAARPFGVEGTSRLDFDGSTLVLRPGPDSRGFAWGREYKVEDMVAKYSDPLNPGLTGDVTGAVDAVATELPLLEARLRGSSWPDQTVSLHIAPITADNNPGQAVASLNAALAAARMTFMDSLLAAHLIPASEPQNGLAAGDDPGAAGVEWTGFLTPYYQHLSGNDPDYSAHSAGLTAGGSARFNERLALGGHLGFDHTKSSGDLLDMDGRTLTGFAGLHGIWNITPAWYLRGQLTGFLSQSTRYWTGGRPEYPLSADADADGHGLYAALRGGYVWNIDERHSLSPELGLDWLRTHQDAFSLNWTGRGGADLPGYAMSFRAEDASVLSGTALLRWRGHFALAGGRLLPGLGLGVRQVLAGDDVKSRLRFGGSSFSTRAPADDTSALAEADLAWTRDKVGVSLAYAGEYGSHRQSHAGRLSVRLEF